MTYAAGTGILADEKRRQAGLIVRMDRYASDEVEVIAGLPVTSPARTAFDLGRHMKRSASIGRLDALSRVSRFAISNVEMLIQRYGPVRGGRQLRDLLPLIDPGAESPKESWLRLLLIDNGLPPPETQIPVLDGQDPMAFIDMGWRDLKLGVEYDGDQHRTDRRQYVRDLRRHPMLERLGWEVIRVIAEDKPFDVLRRVREAFLRRRASRLTNRRVPLELPLRNVDLGVMGPYTRRGAARRSRRSCSTSGRSSGSSGPTTADSNISASSGLRARHGPCR